MIEEIEQQLDLLKYWFKQFPFWKKALFTIAYFGWIFLMLYLLLIPTPIWILSK